MFYKLPGIKINHYFFSKRMRLASKNISLFYLFFLQPPVYIHLHFAFQ